MKSKKTLIVLLTIGLALMGAYTVFALDHQMHGDSWEHMHNGEHMDNGEYMQNGEHMHNAGYMHNGMWSQADDHMRGHRAYCWTDSDHNSRHQADDDQQE